MNCTSRAAKIKGLIISYKQIVDFLMWQLKYDVMMRLVLGFYYNDQLDIHRLTAWLGSRVIP